MSLPLNFAYADRTESNKIVPSEVLFVTECSEWGKIGYETASATFRSVQPVYWSNGLPKPDLSGWHGDWIISFKSDLILSRATIESAKKGAINFHPSPPKYRGVGGYWWAIHNGDDVFGVTCHHLDERIDHGAIIKTQSFPIWRGETVENVKHIAAVYSLELLNETLDAMISEKPLVPCGAKWEQHLYTYKELAAAQSMLALTSNSHTTQPDFKSFNAESAMNALQAVLQEDLLTSQQSESCAAKHLSVA